MGLPKILALYLPQYHTTQHNNKWWGEGFTDWETVKRGESYFEEHIQPIVPLKEDYYDLSKIETMKKQAVLAKEYGIDGFVFYHYYFGNGNMELEIPAENLLKNKDVDMPFCFSWANQSWTRTWSKISGNIWAEKYEVFEGADAGDGVLVKQVYGDEKEWEAHFNYLLPFFNDSRYIRIDGKPVFIFFEPTNITCIRPMMKLWQKMAQNNGIDGIFFVGNKIYSNEIGFDALMINEPGEGLRKLQNDNLSKYRNGINCFEYEDYLNVVRQEIPIEGSKTFFSVAVGYDTTLRRGKSGNCIINRRADKFKEALSDLIVKSYQYDNELLIINAWNEWGEGMYLEPDETDQYAYLLAVKEAKEISKTKCSGKDIVSIIKDDNNSRLAEKGYQLGKYQAMSKIYSMWIDVAEQSGCIFKPVLDGMGVSSVAIYGYFDMGKKLERQLIKEGVEVRYAIDRSVSSVTGGLKVFHPEEQLPGVDCVIVTAYEQNALKKFVADKGYKSYTIQELLEKRLSL